MESNMTVIRLTKTKKGIQVIDDNGKVYGTSVNFLQGLLMGKAKGDFVMLKKMPFDVAPDRFKPSELWDPDGVYEGNAAKTLTTTNDALSVKTRKDSEDVKVFEDKMVW